MTEAVSAEVDVEIGCEGQVDQADVEHGEEVELLPAVVVEGAAEPWASCKA